MAAFGQPFGAAGTEHSAGLAPDPGATSHDPPYYLGDDSAYHVIPAPTDTLFLANSAGPLGPYGTPGPTLGRFNVTVVPTTSPDSDPRYASMKIVEIYISTTFDNTTGQYFNLTFDGDTSDVYSYQRFIAGGGSTAQDASLAASSIPLVAVSQGSFWAHVTIYSWNAGSGTRQTAILWDWGNLQPDDTAIYLGHGSGAYAPSEPTSPMSVQLAGETGPYMTLYVDVWGHAGGGA